MKDKRLTVRDIASVIEKIAPRELQETWDNSGFQIEFGDTSADRVLTCLELNMDILREAQALSCSMIVTHHPLIFSGIRKINSGDAEGDMIIELIKSGISVYSCHTPFDKAKGGNNDMLARAIGLVSLKNLAGENVEEPEKMMERNSMFDIGRIGKFRNAVSVSEAAEMLCENLDINRHKIRWTGNPERTVKTVGICTGAGIEFAEAAASKGCELFITGDIKHHEAQKAEDMGIAVIDAGHYGTEKSFGENMRSLLQKHLGGKVEIFAASRSTDPFEVFL